MEKFSFLVFPYRDFYFEKRFGAIVRDLQIIKSLSESPRVESLVVVNRPVSIYERLTTKTSKPQNNGKIHYYDVTSKDLIGPIKGRSWTESCYTPYINQIKSFFEERSSAASIKVVLDFTPLANIQIDKFNSYFTWYDLIDNFEKHNRFSSIESSIVSIKYKSLNAYDLITSVSPGALDSTNHLNSISLIVPNGVAELPKTIEPESNFEFDYGFVGFITNKFSIELLSKLKKLQPNCKIAVFGESFDGKTIDKIKQHASYFGKFHSEDTPEIMKKFRTGIIPYIKNLSHDESPIKLYQYLSYGKPVISTIQYEIIDQWVFTLDSDIDNNPDQNLLSFINKIQSTNTNELINSIRRNLSNDFLWENKIDKLLEKIQNIT